VAKIADVVSKLYDALSDDPEVDVVIENNDDGLIVSIGGQEFDILVQNA